MVEAYALDSKTEWIEERVKTLRQIEIGVERARHSGQLDNETIRHPDSHLDQKTVRSLS